MSRSYIWPQLVFLVILVHTGSLPLAKDSFILQGMTGSNLFINVLVMP